MKVNTDGVLLGALMTVDGASRKLLDIGTGTGTIALMAAQRMDGISYPASAAAPDWTYEGTSDGPESNYIIEGIDIDAPSAEEAAMNFGSSPPAISRASQYMAASGSLPRTDLMNAEIMS